MRAFIFINGVIDDYAPLRTLLRPRDLLIAADGGAHHIRALGRTPDIVVGDLDSIDPAELNELRTQNVAIEQYPREKDETDLELAIDRALREGADEICLVGVAGGRLDQALANMLILAQREWPVPLTLIDGDQRAALLRGPGRMLLHGSVGDTVSAIPLSAEVTGITYRGLRYPLADATIALGSTRGVSNEMAAEEAEVVIERGLLLIVTSGKTAPG